MVEGIAKTTGDLALFKSGSNITGDANKLKKIKDNRKIVIKQHEINVATKVNIDLERRLHELTTRRQKQASKFGDSDEDVVASFLDDLRSRRFQVPLARRRNSPPLQSKQPSSGGPQNIAICNSVKSRLQMT